ncbi:MAG: adenosylcobinamide kinase [Candidatus Magnetoglobus multicellularis str. Araruama]|uniref:Adenosylcobinamide kinase n=1 Tax=Candidatus Magnetoglobus multicellularis str. Araruama TaxID=890399 RepID=A0A1V1PCB0_9BACT|nr:MAG: adenosylcobinamide kinase [Candidatus Magnetoglobus multicellularis str. Araruama]
MKTIQFILGGCRSGKSKYALNYANKHWHSPKCFIATSEPLDNEMQSRITNHQKERGADWQTIECPIELSQVIQKESHQFSGMLIDCITLWINNLMCQKMKEPAIKKQIVLLLDAIQHSDCPIIIVSNEVGLGIVPDNFMARLYRDLVGYANQQIANIADQVVFMVAGIPIMNYHKS